MKSFSLKNDTVKLGEEIYMDIEYDGYVDWISFGLTHKETGQKLLPSIWNNSGDVTSNWTKNSSFSLTGGDGILAAITGEYIINTVNLCVTNSGCKFYSNTVSNNEYEYIYDRSQKREKRSKKEIGISAVRGGTIVGDHDVIFAGVDEVITFSHTAYSKAVFGKGAVQAAKFLAGKPAGYYNMSHVIEEA